MNEADLISSGIEFQYPLYTSSEVGYVTVLQVYVYSYEFDNCNSTQIIVIQWQRSTIQLPLLFVYKRTFRCRCLTADFQVLEQDLMQFFNSQTCLDKAVPSGVIFASTMIYSFWIEFQTHFLSFRFDVTFYFVVSSLILKQKRKAIFKTLLKLRQFNTLCQEPINRGLYLH